MISGLILLAMTCDSTVLYGVLVVEVSIDKLEPVMPNLQNIYLNGGTACVYCIWGLRLLVNMFRHILLSSPSP